MSAVPSLSGPFRAQASGPLQGTARIPGDKSISHRTVMFGGMATGVTRARGLLEGEDVQATRRAMVALGAQCWEEADGVQAIRGFGGAAGAQDPSDVLDLGNSGTSARLLMGVLAGLGRTACLTGDGSLRKRPMGRVAVPLRQMGASILAREGDRLPLAITGNPTASSLFTYTLPVASAQVKSCLMLAALGTPNGLEITEPVATRDHTERMLGGFGVTLDSQEDSDGGRVHHVPGCQSLTAPEGVLEVPADPSSAAFPLVAALITPGSEVRLTGVGLNPTRTGLITTLQEMGADLAVENPRTVGGEPVGDLVARHSRLQGVSVPAARAPSMIDEYPILFVAAACADGTTHMPGLSELRVKESDRLTLMAEMLARAGVSLQVDTTPEAEAMTIRGTGAPPAGGIRARTALDHRIAMASLVLGLVTASPVEIDDIAPVATSFPSFVPTLSALGATLGPAGEDA